MKKRAYACPTLRQLSRGDLTPEQIEWIDSFGPRPKPLELLGLAAAVVIGGVAVALTIVFAVTMGAPW